jgi:hypothetical protein
MGTVLTIAHVQTALRVAGILFSIPTIFHTEWNKWHLRQLEKGTGAATKDLAAKALKERRSREGSEYKLWKVVFIVFGIVLGLLSYLLPLLFH